MHCNNPLTKLEGKSERNDCGGQNNPFVRGKVNRTEKHVVGHIGAGRAMGDAASVACLADEGLRAGANLAGGWCNETL